jgi:hypothetical protein
MNIYELDISWVTTANERRHLHWELLTSERVRAVFLTARDDVLAILFGGDRRDFDAWSRALDEGLHTTATTNEEGAF